MDKIKVLIVSGIVTAEHAFAFITLFLRGVEWAATGDATIPAPDRSGDNRLKPWPFY